jgi:hypothetical protein
LKAQYMKFHRFWSHGGHAADSNATGQFQGFATGNEDDNRSAGFGHVLGGSSSSAEISAPRTEEDRRERAMLAAEARLVTESSGINFLNSNGKVIMVCPCGQVHDADQCPLSSGGNSQEVVNDKDDNMEVEETLPIQTNLPTLEASADIDMSSPPDVVAPPEVVVETLTSETNQLGEQPLPEKFEKLDEPMLPPLSTEELESLGLGGISVWLQNFTERLTALRDQAGQPAARGAMELLLKVVRNIVTSPDEVKFRKLKADNPKINASLLRFGPDVEKLMNLLGFESVVEDGGRLLILRDATFDSVRLRMGQELLERELGPSAVGAH